MECISECYPQLEEALRFLFGALFFVLCGFILGSMSEREAHHERLQEVQKQREKDLDWYGRMIKQRSRY